MRKVDLRVIVLDVPKQDVISRDNVSVKVNAVVYFRIVDPGQAIIQVANVFDATSQLAQTTLRSVLGQHEMDDLLSQRDKLNADIQRILDQTTEAWGIKVTKVEIKNVDLDESMVRAMARQAEAERTRRAKIIHAEGEAQAAQMLVQAAQTLAREPAAMQLRYLQTLADISNEKSSTIVFPLPLDLIGPLLKSPRCASIARGYSHSVVLFLLWQRSAPRRVRTRCTASCQGTVSTCTSSRIAISSCIHSDFWAWASPCATTDRRCCARRRGCSSRASCASAGRFTPSPSVRHGRSGRPRRSAGRC